MQALYCKRFIVVYTGMRCYVFVYGILLYAGIAQCILLYAGIAQCILLYAGIALCILLLHAGIALCILLYQRTGYTIGMRDDGDDDTDDLVADR